MSFKTKTARIKCSCFSLTHFVEVETDEWDDGEVISSICVSNGESGMWERIKTAWEVVCWGTGIFSEIYLDDRQLQQFKDAVARLPPYKESQ